MPNPEDFDEVGTDLVGQDIRWDDCQFAPAWATRLAASMWEMFELACCFIKAKSQPSGSRWVELRDVFVNSGDIG